ncbi:MAG: hypothetical protein PHT58_02415 [Eubacteriales bacterium]|nr:hypothetical protein [Eubacteriales bacterium]
MEQKSKCTFCKYLPIIIAAIIGAIGGYLYYRFVGCASGTCAITSNPIVSIAFGTILGGLIGSLFVSTKACKANRCKEDNHE